MKNTGDAKKVLDQIFEEVKKVIVGQEEMVKQTVIAILCDGNALLEGYPGLAKTLTVKTIANLMDLKFSRIQGTPDLMPSDITGTYIIDESSGKREFRFHPGPIFANVILFDEVNRATPKAQSAVLEAMQERQVTVGNKSFKLERPFFVLATMNPIEQEGTYQLPEAQSDRFLFKVKAVYPEFNDEIEIVDRFAEIGKDNPGLDLKPIIKPETLFQLQEITKKIPIANDVKKYAVELVTKSRQHKELIEYGASPRASIGLVLAAKANALLDGRNYVKKEDVKEMAYPILRHRIILNFEAERNNFKDDDVIGFLLK